MNPACPQSPPPSVTYSSGDLSPKSSFTKRVWPPPPLPPLAAERVKRPTYDQPRVHFEMRQCTHVTSSSTTPLCNSALSFTKCLCLKKTQTNHFFDDGGEREGGLHLTLKLLSARSRISVLEIRRLFYTWLQRGRSGVGETDIGSC